MGRIIILYHDRREQESATGSWVSHTAAGADDEEVRQAIALYSPCTTGRVYASLS